jgi:serine O-acetyltransferase
MSDFHNEPGFRELVEGDLLRHKPGKFSWLAVVTHLRRPSFFAVFIFRASSTCHNKGVLGEIASKMLLSLNYMLHACEIAAGSSIGPGLLLIHPMGVVIGRATIGRNATILQNATLGLKVASNEDAANPAKFPTLGNDVTISAGAVLLGSVKVGDHALVGANAVVLDDVPAHATAVGIPARILPKREKQST